MSIRPTTSPALADQLKDPAYSAYVLLRTLFTVAPILFGLDKFFNLLTHPQHWNMYLAGWINDLVPGTADQCMYLVGAIEIVAGVLVAVAPRIGAWVVAAWLAGIILNLVTGPVSTTSRCATSVCWLAPSRSPGWRRACTAEASGGLNQGAGASHRAQVALGDEALGHRAQRPGGFARPGRRTGERQHLGKHHGGHRVAANREPFLAGHRMARQSAVTESAHVGFVDDIHHSARRTQESDSHQHHRGHDGGFELARTRRPALRCMPQCMTASAACSKRWRPVPICVDTSRWL